jgi:hypothetical protein
MLVQIHSEQDRWALVKTTLTTPSKPRPYVPEDASDINKALLLARFGHDASSVYKTWKPGAPWDHENKKLPRETAFDASTLRIAKAFSETIPVGTTGNMYRERAGAYIFKHRHAIAKSNTEHEPPLTRNFPDAETPAHMLRLDRHTGVVNNVLSAVWRHRGMSELPPVVTKYQMDGYNIKRAAQGFIDYEKALGLVMPRAYDEHFKSMPNERAQDARMPANPGGAPITIEARSKLRTQTILNQSAGDTGTLPAHYGRMPELLEDPRWRNRADTAGANQRQDDFIKGQQGRPVITGWTKQATLEVGVYDQRSKQVNYHYISALELRSPVDIHSDGKGGVKLTNRAVMPLSIEQFNQPPPAQKGLHPLLKEALEPMLARNQPADDLATKVRGALYGSRGDIIKEMDWSKEIDSMISDHPKSNTAQLVKKVNWLVYEHSKTRGIAPSEPVSTRDIIFAARVAEAKQAGLDRPAVNDHSPEIIALRPSEFAKAPRVSLDSRAPFEMVPLSLRAALSDARRHVAAGAESLATTKDGGPNPLLTTAREKITAHYTLKRQRDHTAASLPDAKRPRQGDRQGERSRDRGGR